MFVGVSSHAPYLRVIALCDIVQHLVQYVSTAHTWPRPACSRVSGLEYLKRTKSARFVKSTIKNQ